MILFKYLLFNIVFLLHCSPEKHFADQTLKTKLGG